MLCLFDLDGTLIDSELGVTACIRHALGRLDVAMPADLRMFVVPAHAGTTNIFTASLKTSTAIHPHSASASPETPR